VVEEGADAGDVIAGLLGQRVVDDDEAVLGPAVVAVLLQELEPLVIELRFVPVVLREEVVQRSLSS
jgi:hypothetical protein